MKVTSNIENSNYIRWATGLIEPVINQAGINVMRLLLVIRIYG